MELQFGKKVSTLFVLLAACYLLVAAKSSSHLSQKQRTQIENGERNYEPAAAAQLSSGQKQQVVPGKWSPVDEVEDDDRSIGQLNNEIELVTKVERQDAQAKGGISQQAGDIGSEMGKISLNAGEQEESSRLDKEAAPGLASSIWPARLATSRGSSPATLRPPNSDGGELDSKG